MGIPDDEAWEGLVRTLDAAGWNEAPEGLDAVRLALFDLVEQVIK